MSLPPAAAAQLAINGAAPGITPAFSAAALRLILDAEGLDQPGRWPGGESGVTLGHGYDLGYHTAAELRRDWGSHLPAHQVEALVYAIGKTGQLARAFAPTLRGICVTVDAADDVFMGATLPKYRRQTAGAFPGYEGLPLDAQGALVSLVFNRGPALDGPRRREMHAIHDVLADGVQRGDLAAIAAQIRASKRLWIGQGLDGLLRRREAEACLVERSGG